MLARIDRLPGGSLLGIWQMTEREDELPCPPALSLDGCASRQRRLEKLCTHALLHAMTGRWLPLRHLPGGCPVTDGRQISISHTRGWVAAVLSEEKRVGVDIEYRSDRVDRVAERFLCAEERPDTTLGRLVCWCAKETVYKLFSEQRLGYEDMCVEPFEAVLAGKVWVRVVPMGIKVAVGYEAASDFVLAWAEEKR